MTLKQSDKTRIHSLKTVFSQSLRCWVMMVAVPLCASFVMSCSTQRPESNLRNSKSTEPAMESVEESDELFAAPIPACGANDYPTSKPGGAAHNACKAKVAGDKNLKCAWGAGGYLQKSPAPTAAKICAAGALLPKKGAYNQNVFTCDQTIVHKLPSGGSGSYKVRYDFACAYCCPTL